MTIFKRLQALWNWQPRQREKARTIFGPIDLGLVIIEFQGKKATGEAMVYLTAHRIEFTGSTAWLRAIDRLASSGPLAVHQFMVKDEGNLMTFKRARIEQISREEDSNYRRTVLFGFEADEDGAFFRIGTQG
jgi:hypothetical protein